MVTKKMIMYSDGGARGNPGPGGSGAVLWYEGKIVGRYGRYLGVTTNNQAEYGGLLMGLEQALEQNTTELEVRMDSLLIVNQCKRTFKVRDAKLQSLYLKVVNLAQRFQKISYHHVPREQNKDADAMVNLAIDRGISGTIMANQIVMNESI
jgi:ribonuclease HI